MAEPFDPDLDALAAELALGLLTGDERARALRLSLSDRAFAEAVDAWRARLDPMYDGFEAQPAPDVWPAIAARLGPGGADMGKRLRRWRWTAIGSTGIAAAFAAAFLLARPEPVTIVREVVRAPAEATVAQLGGAEGTLLAANYAPGDGDLRIRAVSLPQSDRVPELWVIPADGVPRSLGLLEGAGTTRVKVPAALQALIVDGATLAVSLELPDGAPHQAPSATPIATGKITRI
ncbi:MAG TPA: hypothetical protein DEP91_03675 [Sphingomonas bacterium]|jgi:anti-sigma-K factor RskA|uniref:Anti-sigma K factor RskA C-terminal domain-containing protein n=1 Tax=Sphingomonas bacterium TaxID=1895847 RepID=A0A3D0W9N9_9SPHN|nr:hypothetical protein [Sphingomonas bacterium]